MLAAIPNGQFVNPGYEIARVTVKAVRTTRVYFGADAAQEVDGSTSDATAACHASLNSRATQLTVFCEHDVVNPTAAHVHFAPAGENGAHRPSP